MTALPKVQEMHCGQEPVRGIQWVVSDRLQSAGTFSAPQHQDRVDLRSAVIKQPRHVGKDTQLPKFLRRLSPQNGRIVRLPIFVEQRHSDVEDDPTFVGGDFEAVATDFVCSSMNGDAHLVPMLSGVLLAVVSCRVPCEV